MHAVSYSYFSKIVVSLCLYPCIIGQKLQQDLEAAGPAQSIGIKISQSNVKDKILQRKAQETINIIRSFIVWLHISALQDNILI